MIKSVSKATRYDGIARFEKDQQVDLGEEDEEERAPRITFLNLKVLAPCWCFGRERCRT
jgi:hypothetical protein